MKKSLSVCVLSAMLLAALSGCASSSPYVGVDLSRDLSTETVARYEREWQEMRAAGHPEGMAVLERTNSWPLGLIAYHRDSSVMRMPGPAGPTYTVMDGKGIGPLSILYASSAHATFDRNGKRLGGMKMDNYLLMHLAMVHESDILLPDGRAERMSAVALFMHLINIQKMNGHTYVSILTLPNAIGRMLGMGHGGHAGHAM